MRVKTSNFQAAGKCYFASLDMLGFSWLHSCFYYVLTGTEESGREYQGFTTLKHLFLCYRLM